jgi:hypothetical protein
VTDPATLNGCWEKTLRAGALHRLLHKKWREAITPETYATGLQEDGQPGGYLVWIEAKQPPPLALSVIVGEIAHDLRSALDHLIWRQAVEHIGEAEAERHYRKIAFPIYDTSREFLDKAQALKFVSEDTGTLIESYQPYKRGNGYLAIVHWLNRMDKHRALQPATTFAHACDMLDLVRWNPAAELLEKETLINAGDRLEGRANLVRLRFAVPGPDPDVQVQGKPPLLVSFGDAPPHLRGIPIPPTIREVQHVIADFGRLLV